MHDAIVCKHFLGCKPFQNFHTPLSIAWKYFLFQEKSEKARLTREESYRVLKEKRTTEILSQFQKTKALWEKKAAEDCKKIEKAWEQQGIGIHYMSCLCLNVLFTFCELVVVFFVKVKHWPTNDNMSNTSGTGSHFKLFHVSYMLFAGYILVEAPKLGGVGGAREE